MDKDRKLFKSVLRQFFLYSKVQTNFLKKNRILASQLHKKPPGRRNPLAHLPPTRKVRFLYPCNSCKHFFSRKAIELDHKTPLSSVSQKLSLIEWCVETLKLCLEEKNLQILCKSCHNKKTMLGRRKK